MGEQDAENRKTLSVDSVPLDESGLRELLVGERNPSARVHNFCIQNLHIIQILVYTKLLHTHSVCSNLFIPEGLAGVCCQVR